MRTAFYSKELSQFISEHRPFVLQTFPSVALSKMTVGVSVLILDSRYPGQATAVVHNSFIGRLTRRMPGTTAPFSMGETYPFTSAMLYPLDEDQPHTCNNVPPPPIANPLCAGHKGTMATCVAETDGDRYVSFLNSSRRVVITPLL